MRESLLVLAVLLVTVADVYPQDKIVFRSSLHPDKVYECKMDLELTMVMDLLVDDSVREALKKRGVQLPALITMKHQVVSVTETGKREEDGSFPVTMDLDDAGTSIQVNGRDVPSGSDKAGLKGSTLRGRVASDGRVIIEGIEGGGIDEREKQAIIQTMDSMQQCAKFPEEPLDLGDTFVQKMPMEIPVPGFPPVNVIIESTFKLSRVGDGWADFDVIQDFSLGHFSDKVRVKLYGHGKGVLRHNIEEAFTAAYRTSMTMNMTVEGEGVTVKADVVSKVDMEQEVRNRQMRPAEEPAAGKPGPLCPELSRLGTDSGGGEWPGLHGVMSPGRDDVGQLAFGKEAPCEAVMLHGSAVPPDSG